RGAGEVVGVGEQPIGGVALVAGEFPRCGLGAVEQLGDAAAKLAVARRLPQVPGGSGVAAERVEVWWLVTDTIDCTHPTPAYRRCVTRYRTRTMTWGTRKAPTTTR